MNVTALFLTLLGAALGGAVGLLAGRGRLAPLVAARDAALSERDAARRECVTAQERTAIAEVEAAELRTALEYERTAAAEKVAFVEQSQTRLSESFRALSAQALDGASRQFLDLADSRMREAGEKATGDLEQRRQAVEHLVAPLRETLGKMQEQLRDIETARASAYGALVEQVRSAQQTSQRLQAETSSLVTALRKPQARGAWGEMHLKRVVEVAGMTAHCDFTEQPTLAGPDGPQRPDLVVHLAGGKNVVVDSKVPFNAFLEASETTDEQVRAERLTAHARHLRGHVDALSSKRYWERCTPGPEFVVLFVPAEAFLAPALDRDPGLLEYAAIRKVVIASPTTLIGLLRTVAYAWTQDALTDKTKEVFELGRELYARLGKLGEYVDKLGRSLMRTVSAYNETVGSLETRVLSSARKLAEMKVVDGDLAAPQAVEAAARPLGAPVLIEAAQEARALVALPRPSVEEAPVMDKTSQTDTREAGIG